MDRNVMKERLAISIASITKNYKGPMKTPCVFDRALRNRVVVSELLNYLQEDITAGKIAEHINVVCSGKFGKMVKGMSPYFVIWLEGGLRWKEAPVPVLTENPGICVFIDDGIYTCRTYSKIRSAIEEAGGELTGAYFGYKAGEPYRPIYMRSICTAEEVRRYLNGN